MARGLVFSTDFRSRLAQLGIVMTVPFFCSDFNYTESGDIHVWYNGGKNGGDRVIYICKMHISLITKSQPFIGMNV
jgi:hypothetical protein